MSNQLPHLPIYMDYSATTPVDPRVVDKMIPYLREQFGNPASRSHSYGWDAERAVEQAREEVAALVKADPREIIWTSGATESDNLAIKGAAHFYKSRGKHVVTLKTEHKAVLDTCRELEREGFEVTYLDVKSDGLLDLDVLKAALRPDTILVSIMFVNNEIGVIQDIEAIGELCRERNIIFHVDAAQATGKVEIDLGRLKVDLMSFSAHKTYGPKGIGALYVRRKPRVRIEAQMHGGGHERGMRSGTLPTHQIVGMGEAFRIAREEMATENERVRMLRDRLLRGLSEMDEVYVNGDMERRIPHNLNLSFNFVEGESLIMAIKDVAVSSGSACTSASLEPSYVLRALGRNDELAHSSIRFTVGRFTTEQEVDYVVDLLKGKIAKLRDLSPLWEMHQDGIDLSTIKWAAH
ncbi:IscS subfamily cysteine desulfurase [Trinickia caryophylli]|uniref:Cysteine desulfurase IscS n=1 Tax=Trinickia caryophylli TaxID=28094 RepID=A0A1X7DF44_TRICW|nr:IscS subfamily cysteine desulfurase [Trinickia caryophylli]PMS08874.1 IscS subfamily cysteine desulfurase [Trinickia caryophylli]TRX16899.1 IscS subfamily cysteine desulfurase [Trinickia caryophylli]WQE12370.1 IscS subfamily cysteine desulfurase [Trinickia caryophylli]SMF14474.1 cysteine desulfurase IscS [Trinickia caryophylli]GLU31482.1 cysteine desulfurase IscS [Trinickia caryophylli]